MTATQLPLSLAQRHNNQQLFSDHYLNVTLPQRPEWKLLAHEAGQVLAQIAPIVRAYVPSDNEAQTEEDLIRPILRVLGHTFEVQPALKTPDGTKKPDYVFYRDLAVLNANKNRTLDEALLQGKAFAVGDAKYWDRPLDQNLKRANADPFTNKNPAYQIAFYIQHSGVEWGILTNGRLWRLYHKDTAHKQDRFYEVDLPALVEAGDAEAFLYFYAFFHRSAFEPGPLSLDALLKESAAYARGVGESLKGQVYDALKELAQGFLDYPGNTLATDTATLKQIYDHSLIVLYRLLFILYAEARELLPLRESAAYRDEYSLDVIKREIARRKTTGAALLPTTARYWPRLKDLFGIISAGSPPLKVATFNGGLFDPAKHPFLERYTVGDARLIEALDKLARVGGQFVDYRDLAERHLGTIYEGLLEYHLEASDEGQRATSPQPQASSLQGFTVDLFNDRGERHRTGSYYTPDFVVQYIVDQTLRPILDAAVAGKPTDAEKIAAVLEVNCADPAMGSGHFPVAAMEYIARYLVDLGVTPENQEPGTENQEQSGSQFSVLGSESDLAYWKRRVAQNCIYGVDLNPLAVDLAKLSLWLATAAKGKPLSFLDHHLRCGNALVGARVADLNTGSTPKKARTAKKSQPAAGQISMLDDADFARSMGLAVGSMWLIEETAGNTLAEVREQERLYADLRAELTRKYQKLADVAAARDFGLTVDTTLWRGLSDYLARGGFEVPQFATVLKEAEAQAQAQRFFHWDLEFPEVFFDRHGQPLGAQGGFDAVIGNPPYVRQEQLAPIKPYLQSAYAETFSGTADLFVYFFQQGIRVLREGGRMSYISSNAWLQTNYAEPLRRFIRTTTTIDTLIDLGNNRTFVEAPDVCPSIFVISNKPPSEEHQFIAVEFQRGEEPTLSEAKITEKAINITQHDQPDTGWQIEADDVRNIFRKLIARGRAFGEVANGRLFRGLITGLNDAFVVDQATRDRFVQADPSAAAILKRFMRGEDLRPWYQEDEGRWLILFPTKWTERTFGSGLGEDKAWSLLQAKYPSIAEHLMPFAAAGRARGDKGNYWWELRPCDYYDAFEQHKILWPDIGKIPRFSYADPGSYIGNTGYFTPTQDTFLLGFLQSRVAWMLVSKICLHNKFRNGLWEYRLFTQFISRLPIPDAPDVERDAIGEIAMKITAEARARYELHRRAHRRILADLGTPDKALNQKLTAWWNMDFPAFRAEIQKVFKRDISLKERDDWEEWLQARRAEHWQRTEAIVRMETELNARVYALFDLVPAEIKIIEESTKYQYGEV